MITPATPIPTRSLGERGPAITTLGLGTYAIGGGGWSSGWGEQDDGESLAAIRRALEFGLNWIDTAAEYGLGHSEEVVGRALKELPEDERPYVFTKCGLVWDPAKPMVESRQILKPESIRRECEDSLRRLGVERIDLYQFHMPDQTGTSIEESWSEMARLADEGRGALVWGLQLHNRSTRPLRGHPPRRLAATALVAARARFRR